MRPDPRSLVLLAALAFACPYARLAQADEEPPGSDMLLEGAFEDLAAPAERARDAAVRRLVALLPEGRDRVLARPGMSEDRFEAILAKQMPDAEKRRRAHFLVDTGKGMDPAKRQVRAILKALAAAG